MSQPNQTVKFLHPSGYPTFLLLLCNTVAIVKMQKKSSSMTCLPCLAKPNKLIFFLFYKCVSDKQNLRRWWVLRPQTRLAELRLWFGFSENRQQNNQMALYGLPLHIFSTHLPLHISFTLQTTAIKNKLLLLVLRCIILKNFPQFSQMLIEVSY